MYAKRAFVHWYYDEGMEETDFNESQDNLLTLELDYREVAADTQLNNEVEI